MAPIKSTFGRSVGKLLGSLRERDLRLTSGVRTNRYILLGATGGTISLSRTGYSVHTFTPSTSSVFQWNATSSIPGIEYLVIGGGGAGGDYFGPFPGYNSAAGGGGAGGMRSGTLTLPSSGSFSISVGPGGQSSVTSFPQSPTVFAQPGTASYANFPTGTITSEGGGRGGAGNAGGPGPQETKSYAADNGGSGGGAVRDIFTTAGTGNRVAGTSTPVPSQGNPGGNFAGSEAPGGGGGGAGSVGNGPGPGGSGSTSSITGTSLTHAGGGGGGAGYSSNVAGTGGSGGGGAGGPGPAPTPASNGNPASPTAPGANYGAGGGGSGHAGSISYNMAPGGDANPGVVIIAVPTAYF